MPTNPLELRSWARCPRLLATWTRRTRGLISGSHTLYSHAQSSIGDDASTEPLKISGYFWVMIELSGFAGAESLTSRYGVIHACAVGNAAAPG